MAIFTEIISIDVSGCFTCSAGPVMAACAITYDADMIKLSVTPIDIGMAIVAGIGAGNVRGMLTSGAGAVMAAKTSTNNHVVINP
jgi:hypothetical protein